MGGVTRPCIMGHKLEEWKSSKAEIWKQKLDALELRKKSQVGFKHPLESEDFQEMLIYQASQSLEKSSQVCAAQNLCV